MSENATSTVSETSPTAEVQETDTEVQEFRQGFEAESGGDSSIPHSSELVGVDLPEIVFGWIAILAWLILLTAGLIVNSKRHRDILAGTHQWPKQIAEAQLAEETTKAEAKLAAEKAEAEAGTRDTQLLALVTKVSQLLDQELSQVELAATPRSSEIVTANSEVQSTADDSAADGETSSPPSDAGGRANPKAGESITPALTASIDPTLKAEPTTWDLTRAWIIVLTAYTFPNLALLSCIAAIVGGFCRQMRSHEALPQTRAGATYGARMAIVAATYTEAAMRGFVVYLTLIGGLFLLGTAAFSENLQAQDMQAQYIRLAGTLSLLAFITGYDVRVFKRAIDRVVDWLDRDARGQ